MQDRRDVGRRERDIDNKEGKDRSIMSAGRRGRLCDGVMGALNLKRQN